MSITSINPYQYDTSGLGTHLGGEPNLLGIIGTLASPAGSPSTPMPTTKYKKVIVFSSEGYHPDSIINMSLLWKIIRAFLMVISFGAVRLYQNHQFKKALFKGGAEGIKDAIKAIQWGAANYLTSNEMRELATQGKMDSVEFLIAQESDDAKGGLTSLDLGRNYDFMYSPQSKPFLNLYLKYHALKGSRTTEYFVNQHGSFQANLHSSTNTLPSLITYVFASVREAFEVERKKSGLGLAEKDFWLEQGLELTSDLLQKCQPQCFEDFDLMSRFLENGADPNIRFEIRSNEEVAYARYERIGSLPLLPSIVGPVESPLEYLCDRYKTTQDAGKKRKIERVIDLFLHHNATVTTAALSYVTQEALAKKLLERIPEAERKDFFEKGMQGTLMNAVKSGDLDTINSFVRNPENHKFITSEHFDTAVECNSRYDTPLLLLDAFTPDSETSFDILFSELSCKNTHPSFINLHGMKLLRNMVEKLMTTDQGQKLLRKVFLKSQDNLSYVYLLGFDGQDVGGLQKRLFAIIGPCDNGGAISKAVTRLVDNIVSWRNDASQRSKYNQILLSLLPTVRAQGIQLDYEAIHTAHLYQNHELVQLLSSCDPRLANQYEAEIERRRRYRFEVERLAYEASVARS